jgi:hypothetical protein
MRDDLVLPLDDESLLTPRTPRAKGNHKGTPDAGYTGRGLRRAHFLGNRLGANLAGAAVILFCVILPWALTSLADSIEEANGDSYIRALYSAAGGIPGVGSSPRSTLLDQQYYFVNGCVSPPGECDGALAANWGEYYVELRKLYEEAAQLVRCEQFQSFDRWAEEHTHFLSSHIAPAGAYDIVQSLAANTLSGDIHMVGTSAGGAALFSYLSEAMRGDVALDRRIRSVLTIDAPLGYQPPLTSDRSDRVLRVVLNGVQASAMKSDVQPGIGLWARAANIALLTIDTQQDIVGFDAVLNVPNDAQPVYSQSDAPRAADYLNCTGVLCRVEHMTEFLDLGSTWHIYTGSHMANSARQFIDAHWR